MRMRIIDDPAHRLARHPDPDSCWMRCDECGRFFQYKDARPLGQRRRDLCPFDDCSGMGVGFNLFLWDDMREPDDPRWPSSEDELWHGRRSPEMGSFYAAQLEARVGRLVAAFEASPEATALREAGPLRYLAPFFQMQSDLDCDLTDGEEPCTDELDHSWIDLLPSWSRESDPAQAQRMVEELRAFFAFAERTGAVPRPELWVDLLEGEEAEAYLRAAME